MSKNFLKILSIHGHGNGDYGARGYGGKSERQYIDKFAKEFEDALRAHGHTVVVYPTHRNAYQDICNGCFQVDPNDFDYAVETHFNAFNGQARGTECYVVYAEKGISVEQSMMKQMGKHFKLRDNDSVFDGVKRTNFAVINGLKQAGLSACLLEVCFCDNKQDVSILNSRIKEIAEDAAMGVDLGFGYDGKEEVKPKPPVANQILEVGSIVYMYDGLLIDKINIPENLVHVPAIGGWVCGDAFIETGGNNKVDQWLYPGSKGHIKGHFTVTAVNAAKDIVFLKELGYWVKAGCLHEVKDGK